MRIFRIPEARRLITATIVLSVAQSFVFTFCIIFQCTPVSYFWNGWDGLHSGFCINRWATFLAAGVIAIVLDVTLTLLPLRWILQLQITRAKKITMFIMFALSIIIISTSALRLVMIYRFIHSTNFTRVLPDLALWGEIELYAAIVCACIPSLRPLADPLISGLKTLRSGNTGSREASGGRTEPSGPPSAPQRSILRTTVIQQNMVRLWGSETRLTTTPSDTIELHDW
ncbi:hypothetical protein GGR52DRAFT_283746 [Hypoxylon sp. FL1284]|nr:hypothetical protein GGR52DRAFT_283746 [Hypoxylon sp. FL1284]